MRVENVEGESLGFLGEPAAITRELLTRELLVLSGSVSAVALL